jgi:hypothetical protein
MHALRGYSGLESRQKYDIVAMAIVQLLPQIALKQRV